MMSFFYQIHNYVVQKVSVVYISSELNEICVFMSIVQFWNCIIEQSVNQIVGKSLLVLLYPFRSHLDKVQKITIYIVHKGKRWSEVTCLSLLLSFPLFIKTNSIIITSHYTVIKIMYEGKTQPKAKFCTKNTHAYTRWYFLTSACDRYRLTIFLKSPSRPYYLLFIEVVYELIKCKILCLICFPELLHHLEIPETLFSMEVTYDAMTSDLPNHLPLASSWYNYIITRNFSEISRKMDKIKFF